MKSDVVINAMANTTKRGWPFTITLTYGEETYHKADIMDWIVYEDDRLLVLLFEDRTFVFIDTNSIIQIKVSKERE